MIEYQSLFIKELSYLEVLVSCGHMFLLYKKAEVEFIDAPPGHILLPGQYKHICKTENITRDGIQTTLSYIKFPKLNSNTQRQARVI